MTNDHLCLGIFGNAPMALGGSGSGSGHPDDLEYSDKDKICHPSTGRCFWPGPTPLNWTSAQDHCLSTGGQLAVLETLELWDYAKAGLE